MESIEAINKVTDYLNAVKKQIIFLEERINGLYMETHSMRHMIEELSGDYDGAVRIPHRCPLCHGSTLDEDGAFCRPCNGRGIVWG